MRNLRSSIDALEGNTDLAPVQSEQAVNELLIMIGASFVLLMQLGFALLENGLVRPKNSKNILIKNVFDTSVSTITFWLVGFGLAFGLKDDGDFIGLDPRFFAASKFDEMEENYYLMWVFQYSFATTAATIVSGSLAERTQLPAYLAFSAFMTGFTYPIAVSWTWGGGWLGDANDEGLGFHDFAGAGMVHILGGVAGFIGASMVGPRYGMEKNPAKRKNLFDEKESLEWVKK